MMQKIILKKGEAKLDRRYSNLVEELQNIKRRKLLAEEQHAAECISLPIETAIGRYISKRENINTKLAHRCDLNQFSDYLLINNISTIGDLGGIPTHKMRALCEGWLDSLLEINFKKITIQRKKGTIVTFFKFLNRELPSLVSEVPVLNSEKHRDYYARAKTNNFTYDEWRDFRRTIEKNPRTYKLYVMVQMAMLLGGRRIGEILNILWDDINFSESTVKIIPSKKKHDSTEFILPLSTTLKNLLLEYKNGSSYKHNDPKIFPDETQQRIDSKIRYYTKKSGIKKKLSFHSIRTSFVTWANEQGHSQSEILNATLHSSAKMIRYYDKTEPLQVNSILRMRHL